MRKHKKIIFSILIFIISVTIVWTIITNRQRIDNQLFFMVDALLDYEHASEVGDDFQKISWGDLTFQINHYKSGNALDYVPGRDKAGERITLLNSIKRYKFADGKLYVIASDGYAVIDGNNIAKIYTSKDKITAENVYYIDRYEDFEKIEQDTFQSMM